MPSGYAEPSDLEMDPPPDPLLRPVWEDTPDETDGVPGVALRPDGLTPPSPPGNRAGLPAAAVFPLLVPLCDAQDALSRLDARAAAAPEPVRAGLIARMAWREAAGWLAHAHAWADPRDLALRDLGLTGSYTIATMVGRAVRDLPNTYARRATRPWEDQDTESIRISGVSCCDGLSGAGGVVVGEAWVPSFEQWPERAVEARMPSCALKALVSYEFENLAWPYATNLTTSAATPASVYARHWARGLFPVTQSSEFRLRSTIPQDPASRTPIQGMLAELAWREILFGKLPIAGRLPITMPAAAR